MSSAEILKSFLRPAVLAERIAGQYPLSGVRCQLLAATMRDVYLVQADEGRFICYLYRAGQRREPEIEAEWRFVALLAQSGVPVLPAPPTREGRALFSVIAPEGRRYGVLTSFVEATSLRRRSSESIVRAYGRAIGLLHVSADQMTETFSRPAVDLQQIVAESVAAFARVATARADEVALLRRAMAILRPRLAELAEERTEGHGKYGMIHGDVIQANALVDAQGRVTVIDFDLCGPGWRAYDLASYLLAISDLPEERAWRTAFLEGYAEIRVPEPEEQELLPLFQSVRALFSIGVPAAHVDTWGLAYLNAFLPQSLGRLARCLDELGE